MLGLPDRIDVTAPDGTVRHDRPMWTYHLVREGTVDLDPAFRHNAYVVADCNHGYKLLGVGALVAKELLGEPQDLLEPFRFSRFRTGRLHPTSNSPFPGADRGADTSAHPPRPVHIRGGPVPLRPPHRPRGRHRQQPHPVAPGRGPRVAVGRLRRRAAVGQRRGCLRRHGRRHPRGRRRPGAGPRTGCEAGAVRPGRNAARSLYLWLPPGTPLWHSGSTYVPSDPTRAAAVLGSRPEDLALAAEDEAGYDDRPEDRA